MLVGASVIASATDPGSYAEAIDLFAQSDADFVELDLGYARFYYDPHFSVQVAKKAKQKLSIPVTVKMAPFLTNPTEVIRNYEQAGVDGLCLFDLYYMLDFDINELKLPFRGTYQTYTEGVTLPYTNRCIADARLAGLRVPISASFGVWRWEDVIKCIMSGADTVQICRTVMVRGFEVATSWLNSINKWLDAKGYKTISELKGEILQHIVDFRALPFEVPLIRGGKPSLRSEINLAKCNGCLLCKPACLYFAIKTEDNLATIDETRCEGCGTCVGICPTEAITLVPR